MFGIKGSSQIVEYDDQFGDLAFAKYQPHGDGRTLCCFLDDLKYDYRWGVIAKVANETCPVIFIDVLLTKYNVFINIDDQYDEAKCIKDDFVTSIGAHMLRMRSIEDITDEFDKILAEFIRVTRRAQPAVFTTGDDERYVRMADLMPKPRKKRRIHVSDDEDYEYPPTSPIIQNTDIVTKPMQMESILANALKDAKHITPKSYESARYAKSCLLPVENVLRDFGITDYVVNAKVGKKRCLHIYVRPFDVFLEYGRKTECQSKRTREKRVSRDEFLKKRGFTVLFIPRNHSDIKGLILRFLLRVAQKKTIGLFGTKEYQVMEYEVVE